MKPNNDPLRRLKIVSPCTEDWDAMTGNDAVRFCSHCSKDVHNIATITRGEALELVRSSKGRLCAQIVRRPDGSIQTSDALPFFDFIVRAPRAAAGVLSMALAATPVLAQSGDGATCAVNAEQDSANTNKSIELSGSGTISGVVTDESGAVIPEATVTLTSPAGATAVVATDTQGRYEFDRVPVGIYEVHVSAMGFATFDATDAPISGASLVQRDATLSIAGLLGGMIVMTSRGEAMYEHEDERDAFDVAHPVDDDERDPPIYEAIDADSLRAVRKAISTGANVNERTRYDDTPLFGVMRSFGMVKALVEAGADVNAVNRFGVTPLMSAALHGKTKTVKYLLDQGALVNAHDNKGRTALILASAERRDDVIQVLVNAGADRFAVDSDGLTAKDYYGEKLEQ